ncbi:MAG: CerR family C-terminal domain-containing protein [Limisphaerales bacterium]
MKPLTPASRDETRRQLLEAAGAVFADLGFREATIREICRRADANVAAVNYHFGDKATLYLEVLRYAHSMALEKYPPLLGLPESAPPEKKLRAFIHSFLLRIFNKGPTSWHGRLISREMIEPTGALDSLVEERIRPMSRLLGKIVAEILNCPIDDERVWFCGFSVVSQCVFFHHCRPVVSRLFPGQLPQNPASIEKLADHITTFSLTAMKSLRKKPVARR